MDKDALTAREREAWETFHAAVDTISAPTIGERPA